MANTPIDAVGDTTSTTGTSDFVIDGVALTGCVSFASALTNGTTYGYRCETSDKTSWEVGSGVWTSATSTLSRTSVVRSSNGGAKVSFASGAKSIGIVVQAADFPTASGLQGDGSSATQVGFRGIPQNSQSAAYTTVLSDAGKHLLHPSADTTARTFTIDSNANVAYPIGTAITFVNQHSGGVVTISITSDTMRLAGTGTTGNRTLAADGIATALKLTSTEWIISGTGLS